MTTTSPVDVRSPSFSRLQNAPLGHGISTTSCGPKFDHSGSAFDLRSQAFLHWETIHAQLTETIRLYLEACLALHSACTAPDLPDKSYREVDIKLLELCSSEGELIQARSVLTTIRNKSRALTPISVLPSEVLVAIFSIASNECQETCFASVRSVSKPKTPPFASVCTQWRQLYFRWHVSASHLDLVVSGSVADAYYRYAKAVASRSVGAPLHLAIRDRVDKSETTVPSDDVAKLVDFLGPLLPRVCAVDITLKSLSQFLLDFFVLSWAKCRLRAPPKVFKVWNSAEDGPLELRTPIELPDKEQLSSAEFQHFFSSLQTLALYDCSVTSDTGVYKSLVDLRIDWLHTGSISLNILDILVAAPNLHSLAVEDVRFAELGENTEAVPLALLRNISLSQSKIGDSLRHLFPLLNTGSNTLSVIMRIILEPDFTCESQAFFRRSSVKRLFAYGNQRYRYSTVASLCPAPDLQELVLRDCGFLNINSTEDLSVMDENESMRTPWPLLHTLYLVGCTLDLENLKKIVVLHPIRKLRIFNGYVVPDERRKMTPEECTQFEEVFSQAGVDVKCTQDEIGCPTRLNFYYRLYA
ncbi:hypothetical protein FRC12_022422 [Ceratobasidium sp. 428]|nr:hypothetical protein FRC12_022422 [Ceratobasidium sp. 428]